MKKSLMLGLLLPLIGCATPYQEMGFRGGVEVTQLDTSIYRIHSKGNAFTDSARIQDFVLLKSAELAKANGYSHFILLGNSDASQSVDMVTSGNYNSTTSMNAYASGNSVYGNSVTNGTYTPPTQQTFIKPGSMALVKLINNPPPNTAAFNADIILKSLSPKYMQGHG